MGPVNREDRGEYILYEFGDIGGEPGEFDPGLLRVYLEEVVDRIRGDVESIPAEDVVREVSKYLDPDRYDCQLRNRYTYVVPREPFAFHPMPSIESAFEDAGRMILAAFDASYHSPGGHYTLPVMVINIGYGYSILGGERFERHLSGPYHITYLVIPRDLEERPRELISKEVEHLFVRKFAGFLSSLMDSEGIDLSVMMFDENFNLGYASAYSASMRKEYVSMYNEMFSDVVGTGRGGILPVGVYYSGRSSIVKCLKSAGLLDKGVPNYRDRVIMDRLMPPNSRSSLFEVVSEPISDAYRVYTVYMKIEDGNVMMIEYTDHHDWDPATLERMYCSVYIDAYRENGYPYLLSEAHHSAVMSYRQRADIEAILSELVLNEPLEYSMSRKNLGKRWRVL